MPRTSYRRTLIEELSRSLHLHYDDNYDVMNLGPEPPGDPEGEPDAVQEDLFHHDPNRYFEDRFGDRLDIGEHLFTHLADQSSRDLLVTLMAYRLLGHRHVKLPRNTPEYWQGIGQAISSKTAAPTRPINWRGLSLAQYDTTRLGYALRVYAGDTGVACTFIQKQYEYESPEVSIKANIGDVVIDAGACWGETTLYFAQEAGPSGRVYSFEFIPSNYEVLKNNLANNEKLAQSVTVVERPVWRESGLDLYYCDDGPGSRVSLGRLDGMNDNNKVETITIDDAAIMFGMPKIDFIKMDIEGAELAALQGAETSIRNYRPKLAISLYHAPNDFDDIPRYLTNLDLDYSFYLGHHTIYQNETVLYCVPSQ